MSKRILIVEDSPTQAEVLRGHLADAGYLVTATKTGEDALAAVAQESFDVVISDIVMPGPIDGYELCRRIKAGDHKETPVLLLTSLSDPMDIIRGLEAGADNFLTKPYVPEHLLERLEGLLSTRKARGERRFGMGVKVVFMGREFNVTSEREQILDLLVTTFEEAVRQNRALRAREQELTQAKAELARYAHSLEAQLERITHSVPDVLFSASLDLHEVFYMSPAARHVFGCDPDEFSYLYWERGIHPADRNRVIDTLRRAVDRETVQSFEYRFEPPGRSARWVSETLVPVRNGNGRPARLDGIARDISDRKRAEEAIAQSEARFRSLVTATAQIIWTRDPRGNVVGPLPTWQAFTGQSEDAIQGTGWLAALHPDDAEGARTAWETAIKTRSTYAVEYRIRRHDGVYRTFSVRGVPVLADDGTIREWMGACTDITARKRAEAELSAANGRLRAMFEASPLPIVMVDLDANVELWNPAAERVFGWTAEEVLGQRSPVIGDDEDDEYATMLSATLRGQTVGTRETRRKRRDGSDIQVVGSMAPMYDASGHPTGALAVYEDVTEHRKLEDQVRQSQKMDAIGRLAGGVAHDFNNLLSVILGESELALNGLDAADPLRTPFEEIRKAGERSAVLTRQLLAFSRKQTVEPTVFGLNDAVTDMEKMLRRLLPANIELVTRLAPDLSPIEADRGQLEQVIVNLVVNARDAMPDGGHVTIETARFELDDTYTQSRPHLVPGSYVSLAVSDTGTGMSAEVQEHIFEPFFTTKEQGKGTGLGLATCYGIVAQAGGHIAVYSEPGVGTTMRVYLLPSSAPARAKVDSTTTAIPGGTGTILLVEDEKAVRNIESRILRAAGYDVLEAEDGERALELMKEHRDDVILVLTDVVLPGIGGREIANRVRKIKPNVKILYASGYTDDVVLKRDLMEGDAVLVQKPITPVSLTTKVRAVLDS